MRSSIGDIFKKTKAEIAKQYGMKSDMTALEFCSLGAAMINGLKFSFVIDNLGGASDKGLCVALSGDAVSDGRFKASSIELKCTVGGKQALIKKKLQPVTKKDGKLILQAKFESLHIESGLELDKEDEKRFEQKMKNQLCFEFIPEYSGSEDEEIMLTVYPYENILEGAASKWRYVCADASSLIKYLDKN